MSAGGKWVEAIDAKSGKSYYYNKVLNKTQWTKPDDFVAVPLTSSSALTPEAVAEFESSALYWAESLDPKSGRPYWYNKKTKKTSWEKPKCMQDAAATLNKTTAPNANANANSNSASASRNGTISQTDASQSNSKIAASTFITPSVSLDASRDNSISISQLSQSRPMAASVVAASSEPLIVDGQTWKEAKDPASGRSYYYNKATKETRWSKPVSQQQPQAQTDLQQQQQQSESKSSPVDTSSRNNSVSVSTTSTDGTHTNNTGTVVTRAPPPRNGAAAASAQPQSASPPARASTQLTPAEEYHQQQAARSQQLLASANTIRGSQPNNYGTITNVKSGVHASAAQVFNTMQPDSDEKGGGSNSDPGSGNNSGASSPRGGGGKKQGPGDMTIKRNIRSLLRDEDSDEENSDGNRSPRDGQQQQDGTMTRDGTLSISGARRHLTEEDDAASDGTAHDFKFAKHRKGWFNRMFRTGATFDDTRLLTFKKSLIKKALLKQNRDLDEEAVQCFKNIMSYMGDRKSSKAPIDHAKKILHNLMLAPSGLRDEVYMQLCKQTTGNPSIESTVKGWELMSFALATFPPSKALKHFLLDYINKAANATQETSDASMQSHQTNPRVQEVARLCQTRLPAIVSMGQRAQVPSTLELQCLMESKPVPIRVSLANGSFKTFTVDPYTTVADCEHQLASKYNLTLTSPFALYEAASDANVERILDSNQRILDVIAYWENGPLQEEMPVDANDKDKTDKLSKFDKDKQPKMLKHLQQNLDKQVAYSSLLYKAKLVLKTSSPELLADSEAVHLTYVQAQQDVITQRYPCEEKDLTVLAALQLQASQGDYQKSVHVPGWLAPQIEDFVPLAVLLQADPDSKEYKTLHNNKLRNTRKLIQGKKFSKKIESAINEWEQKVLSKYVKVSGFTSLEAQLNYLDYVQEWPYYGCTFFTVEQRQFKDYPSPITLGINCEGVLLLHPEKKTILEKYAYTDIVTWGHSDEKFIIVVGNIVQQRKLIFKTGIGKECNSLIHDYVKAIVALKHSAAQQAQ